MSVRRIKQNMAQTISSRAGDWIERIPVITGNQAGQVVAGKGKIWVRFSNGQEVAVLNTLAPLAFDRHITVGRLRSQPGIWRVVEILESYVQASSNGMIGAHHTQHEFPSFDTIFVNRKQITSLSVLVSDADAFKVFVYGALIRTKNGIVSILNQELELASYIPADGALYAAIETNEDGELSIHVGDTFLSPETASYSDVPSPAPNKYTIAFVMLYDIMTSLTDNLIGLPVPIVTDYDGMDVGYVIHSASNDTPGPNDEFGFWDVVDEALKNITFENLVDSILVITDERYLSSYESYLYETGVAERPINTPHIQIEGSLAVVSDVFTWIASEDGVMLEIGIFVVTPGSSGTTEIDVSKNGSTLFAVEPLPSFLFSDTSPIFFTPDSSSTFVKGDVLSFHITGVAVGSSTLIITPIALGYNNISWLTDEAGDIMTEIIT